MKKLLFIAILLISTTCLSQVSYDKFDTVNTTNITSRAGWDSLLNMPVGDFTLGIQDSAARGYSGNMGGYGWQHIFGDFTFSTATSWYFTVKGWSASTDAYFRFYLGVDVAGDRLLDTSCWRYTVRWFSGDTAKIEIAVDTTGTIFRAQQELKTVLYPGDTLKFTLQNDTTRSWRKGQGDTASWRQITSWYKTWVRKPIRNGLQPNTRTTYGAHLAIKAPTGSATTRLDNYGYMNNAPADTPPAGSFDTEAPTVPSRAITHPIYPNTQIYDTIRYVDNYGLDSAYHRWSTSRTTLGDSLKIKFGTTADTTVVWHISPKTPGWYYYNTRVRDDTGNVYTTGLDSIFVEGAAPAVTGFSFNTSTFDTLTPLSFNITVSSPTPIDKTVLIVDGVRRDSNTTSSYGYTWLTPAHIYGVGSHSAKAITHNADGLYDTSATLLWVVSGGYRSKVFAYYQIYGYGWQPPMNLRTENYFAIIHFGAQTDSLGNIVQTGGYIDPVTATAAPAESIRITNGVPNTYSYTNMDLQDTLINSCKATGTHILLSLAATYGSSWERKLDNLCLDTNKIHTLAGNFASYLYRQGYTGAEIDYEWPNSRDSYQRLVHAISDSVKARLPNAIIVLAINGDPPSSCDNCAISPSYQSAYDTTLLRWVDYFFIMAYDMSDSWITGNHLWFNSGLSPDPTYGTAVGYWPVAKYQITGANVVGPTYKYRGIPSWKQYGYPAEKLIQGMPWYANRHQTAKTSLAEAYNIAPGDSQRANVKTFVNQSDYNIVKSRIANGTYIGQTVWSDSAKMNYSWYVATNNYAIADTTRPYWITGEDSLSTLYKAAWTIQQKGNIGVYGITDGQMLALGAKQYELENGILTAMSLAGIVPEQNTVPNPPTNVYPTNGLTNVPTVETFRCTSDPDAWGYNLSIATDSLFSNVIINQATVYNSFTNNGSPLSYSTTYYMRWNASNLTGTSTWSNKTSFTTAAYVEQNVQPPTLITPINNAVSQDTSLTFTWSSVTGATKYWIQISIDIEFNDPLFTNDSSIVMDIDGIIPTSKSINGFSQLTSYYWRMATKNAAGWGLFSNYNTFTTKNNTIGIPVLVSPTANLTGLSAPIIFRWNRSTNATSYQFQLITDTAGTNYIVNQSSITDTAFTPSASYSLGQAYYWRVRAINSITNSAYSAWRKFTYKTTAPLPSVSTMRLKVETNQVWRGQYRDGTSFWAEGIRWCNPSDAAEPIDSSYVNPFINKEDGMLYYKIKGGYVFKYDATPR